MNETKPFNVFESYAISPIASRDLGPIFPISLKNYMRYVKYRACHPVTFHKYILGLELHKLHGPSWISSVKNYPDALAVVKVVDRRMSLFKPNHRSPFSRRGTSKKKDTSRKGGTKAHAIMVNNNGKIGYKVIIDSDGENEDVKIDNNEGFSEYKDGITDSKDYGVGGANSNESRSDCEDGGIDSNEGLSDYEDELAEDQRITDLFPYEVTVWIKNKYLN